MKTKIYNKQGKEIEMITLPEKIFDVKMNPDLVHQVVVSQMSNRRQGTAHSKDRSERRGSGKKPWRQKGTGRARHGSIRSPIWVGGGITFGPRKERNYKKRIPVKMRRKALFMVLSEKAKQGELLVVDKLEVNSGKTRDIAGIISSLSKNIEGGKDLLKSLLIVLPENKNELVRAARNIEGVEVAQAKDLNALDLLSFKYVLLPKDSVKVIQETFV